MQAIRVLMLVIFNNYWMRLSGISRIIEAEVGVICGSRRLRKITLTEASIILDIPRKPNSIIILLFTWTIIVHIVNDNIVCTAYFLLRSILELQGYFRSRKLSWNLLSEFPCCPWGPSQPVAMIFNTEGEMLLLITKLFRFG